MLTTSITPPTTYAEWVKVLDMLLDKSDDEAVLEAMSKGTLEWQSGVAERFSRKLIDVINSRINSASDKFQREISRAYGQERVFVQSILALRKEMCFLSKAINLSVIPQKEREHYYNLVIDHANKIQTSLEESAKADRTGKLSSIVRNNKVNVF